MYSNKWYSEMLTNNIDDGMNCIVLGTPIGVLLCSLEVLIVQALGMVSPHVMSQREVSILNK